MIHARARVWTLLDFGSVRFPDNTQHRQILKLIYVSSIAYTRILLELHWMHAFLIIPNIHVYVNDTDHVGLVEYGLVSDSKKCPQCMCSNSEFWPTIENHFNVRVGPRIHHETYSIPLWYYLMYRWLVNLWVSMSITWIHRKIVIGPDSSFRLLKLRLQPQARWLSPVHVTGRKVRNSSLSAFCAATLGCNSNGEERKDEARWSRPLPRRDTQYQ